MKSRLMACGVVMVGVLLASQAGAVPFLQLYSPGATYDTLDESWAIEGNPVLLQVLGARNGNMTAIGDLYLHIAIPSVFWTGDASVTVTGPGHESGSTLNDWIYGTPSGGTPAGLPSHGTYPAYYASLLLPDMDLIGATETVHDYNPGADGTATGVIYEYTIEYDGASLLHFDVTGLIYRNPGANTLTFAPFSHDAYAYDRPDDPGEPDLPIAEPNMLSGLAGMLAVAGLRRRRRA